jgi:hypothetical protein
MASTMCQPCERLKRYPRIGLIPSTVILRRPPNEGPLHLAGSIAAANA